MNFLVTNIEVVSKAALAATEYRVQSHETWQEVTLPHFTAVSNLQTPVHSLLDFNYSQSR